MIKIALIGLGYWGPTLLRNLSHRIDCQVTRIVDKDPARLDLVKELVPSAQRSTDVSQAFGDPDIDAVMIATPTKTHDSLVCQALEAGKHVFVEKPLTDNVAAAEKVHALASEQARVLMVGHVYVFNGAVTAIKELTETQQLGQVRYVSAYRSNLGPVRTDTSVTWDLASHDISVMNHLLDAQPLSASAVGGRWLSGEHYDVMFATLRYPGDVLCHLHLSWLEAHKNRLMTVVGDDRMLLFDDTNPKEPIRIYEGRQEDASDRATLSRHLDGFRRSERDGDILSPMLSLGEPLALELAHFIRCVQTGARPLTDARFALGVVKALAAIERSANENGTEMAISPSD